MRNSDRRPGFFNDIGIRLVILVLFSLLLMAMQQTGQLRPIQNFLGRLTSPVQITTSGFTHAVNSLWNEVVGFRTTQQRLTELEKINGSLTVENLRLQEVETENEQLRALLDFAQVRPSFDLRAGQIIARVIGWDSNNFLNYIMLDLGRVHGITTGMPVVTNQGLVGRVSEVTDVTSKVLLITDPASSINVVLQSSRLNGVLVGQPGADPIVDYIPQGETFSVGEIVMTSGLGGRFPKGIPVGQVIEIQQKDFEQSQRAVIRPTVNLDRLELVLVVTNFDPLEEVYDLNLPELQPTNPDDATQDGATTPVAPLEGAAPIEGAAPVEDATPVPGGQ